MYFTHLRRHNGHFASFHLFNHGHAIFEILDGTGPYRFIGMNQIAPFKHQTYRTETKNVVLLQQLANFLRVILFGFAFDFNGVESAFGQASNGYIYLLGPHPVMH